MLQCGDCHGSDCDLSDCGLSGGLRTGPQRNEEGPGAADAVYFTYVD